VYTLKTNQFWKPYCVAISLILLPAAGRADVVLDWNSIMQNLVSSQPPIPQTRFAAITQLAVFEAVNAITKEYKPYLGTVTAPDNASVEAAAAQAAHDVLKNYFPTSGTALDAALVSSLSTIPEGQPKASGIAAGQAAAAAMIAARANDGSAPATFFLPTTSAPGVWQPTPSCTAAGGAFLQWRDITPFGIQSASQFRLGPPPVLTGGRYAAAFNEVDMVGGMNSTMRPQDRSNVALFYAAVTPVGVFNDVYRQISTTQLLSLVENAHNLALLAIAIGDGAIATFDSKYHYNFWRPETAIHNASSDDNDLTLTDPTFTPFIVAPCFPSYPSAHGALSNAARTVLEQIFPIAPFSVSLSNAAVPGVVLKYNTFTEITDDISDARVYGGIHFRTDQDAGTLLGEKVGQYVYAHNLKSARAGCKDQ
jgi:hypothetical protein